MDQFSFLIDEYFKKNIESPIYNTTQEHAKYLVNKIFQKARKKVVIYAGSEDVIFYDEEIKNIIKSKNLDFHIITDNESEAEKFAEIFPKIPIKVLNKDIQINLEAFVSDSKYNLIKHFITADNKYVRIEKPIQNTGIVNSIGFANYKDLAKLLTKISTILIQND